MEDNGKVTLMQELRKNMDGCVRKKKKRKSKDKKINGESRK